MDRTTDESLIATFRVLAACTKVMTPEQCRQVAHELRQFEGEAIERKPLRRRGGAMEIHADDCEREVP